MLSIRLNQPVDKLQVLPYLAEQSPGTATEWTLVRADGETLVAEILVNVLTDEAGRLTGYLAMAHDVTQRRHAEDQLQHVAMHDALTTLPNRNMLQDLLKASLQQAERESLHMAMMFLDLDHVSKKFNDTLGHHIGDSILIEVARRLRSAMRTSDIVARLGGDEFVVLLPRISKSPTANVAQKVLDLFAEPLRVGPTSFASPPALAWRSTLSTDTMPSPLMRHADLAMYQAKNAGRNRVAIYSQQTQSLSPELAQSSKTTSIRPWSAMNCACTSSLSSTATTAASPVWKRCCAGSIAAN